MYVKISHIKVFLSLLLKFNFGQQTLNNFGQNYKSRGGGKSDSDPGGPSLT